MIYDRYLNERIASVPPSGIRRFFDLAASRKDAISLGVGEPDFKTPYLIRDAAINSLIDGETQYTANRGLIELREEVAYYLASRYNISYRPEEEILITIGASEAIDLALRALISDGDEVLVPDPSYVSYAPGVVFAGGVPVPVRTRQEDEFRLKAEALEKAVTGKTKLLILPYPNNPTGAIMEKCDLEAVAEVVARHDLLVISDEIYSELVYDGHEHVSFAALPGMYERTVTINGFSKAFAMTGWRVGYACGAKEIIAVMNKIHQYAIMCAPRQGQVAAAAALRLGRENRYESVLAMRESYDRRRRLMVNAFRSMGLDCFEPYGAFYVFPSIRKTGMSSEEFCSSLLQEKDVAAVPGNAFGASGEGNIRCCYATAVDKINIALDRMADFVASHT
ncbi:MAG: aminotransferase class I/II-fold pyridoxal phosphate-dependent enzyme [Clostridiales bacterium]|nr:aminotransferase class I/II-fold pyridoxal phosphate-dependent enzyme [Clostridiales bacterium]